MRGHTETRWNDRAKAWAVVVALLCVPFAVAAFDSGALPGPSGGASFTATGGTVTQPVVLTGDNAGGVGTLRIRPADEDTQLVLCEASNNSSPEMCTSLIHNNASATLASGQITTNAYVDSAGAYQRYNTSAGYSTINTAAGTSNANNSAGIYVWSTNGTLSGSQVLAVTGAGTSTLTTGASGTVTTDIRGPILNGGSATCDGLNAGSLCITEAITTQTTAAAAGVVGPSVQNTSADGYVQYSLLNSADGLAGQLGYANASYADADYAGKLFTYAGTGVETTFTNGADVAAGTVGWRWADSTNTTGVTLLTLNGAGTIAPLFYGSQSNCSDGAGAAACTAAPAGGVVMDAAATTVVVSTTAVTANSRIFLQEDTSLALTGAPTCNTDAGRTYRVTARTAGTSFTITSSAAPITNPACLSYHIIN